MIPRQLELTLAVNLEGSEDTGNQVIMTWKYRICNVQYANIVLW